MENISSFSIDTTNFDIAELLTHCVNLELLNMGSKEYEGKSLEHSLDMPKLKVLIMDQSMTPFIKLTSKVRSLETVRITRGHCGTKLLSSNVVAQLRQIKRSSTEARQLEDSRLANRSSRWIIP